MYFAHSSMRQPLHATLNRDSFLVLCTGLIRSSINYVSNPDTLGVIEKCYLLLSNFFIQNCDFERALKFTNKSLFYSFRELFFRLDFLSTIKSTNFSKIKQRNIEKNPHIEEMFYRDLDAFSYCHSLYRKGNYISVGEVKTFPCLKYKHKTSLFKNKEQKVDDFSNYVKKKYLLIVDENFLYMSKDKIKLKKKENIRKIGNRINLKRLYRITKIKKENNKVIVKFDFYTDENLTIDDKDSFFTKIYEFDTDTFSLLEDEIKFISKKVKIETK